MHKLRIVIPSLLAAICFLAFTGVALAVQSPTSDQPAPTGPTASPLLIVEFDAPPLSAMYKTQLRAATADGKLDVRRPTPKPMSPSCRQNRLHLSTSCKQCYLPPRLRSLLTKIVCARTMPTR